MDRAKMNKDVRSKFVLFIVLGRILGYLATTIPGRCQVNVRSMSGHRPDMRHEQISGWVVSQIVHGYHHDVRFEPFSRPSWLVQMHGAKLGESVHTLSAAPRIVPDWHSHPHRSLTHLPVHAQVFCGDCASMCAFAAKYMRCITLPRETRGSWTRRSKSTNFAISQPRADIRILRILILEVRIYFVYFFLKTFYFIYIFPFLY